MPKMKLASVFGSNFLFLLKLIFFLSFKFRFCRNCLSSCENASGTSNCPVCRTSFNARQKFNARDIEQQIYQSRGYCSGCNRRVTLCYAPISINLDGGWKARQRPRIWTRSNFWRQMPYPGAIILGQKRTNLLPLQLRLMCFIERSNISTFWVSRIH